tara:strand:+ start:943 stop:1773 length:831 start_codon:yes stop_codon:yes gene_type:complete
MDNSAPDIQASLENADEIAELTGRTKSDVIADLLDDGKLNNSNAIKENTSAIDKATEMAGKTHKLLTALIPILLLVAGSGLELGGIIDLTPAGDDGEGDWAWEDDPYADVYWGCTDWDAINYDDWANEDDGSCYYEEEVWGCTDSNATNYNETANEDDGSCNYEEPAQNCTGSFYNPEVKLEEANNTTDMKLYWDADWSCDEEQYVEIDIFIKWTNNQTNYHNTYAGYNITGDTVDIKVFTKQNIPRNQMFDVCIVFWVDADGWRKDAEWNTTIET